jgi:MtN3 and saliva related transmembrane protein
MIILYNTTDEIYVSSQIVGYIAGVLVVLYNVPQLIRMIRTKSTDDVELVSLLFQIILNLMYITYGALMQEIPILISESLAFLICGSMIILKRLYDKKKITDTQDDANEEVSEEIDIEKDNTASKTNK